MAQTYSKIGPSRLSGEEDEWRILIRWEEGAPTALYPVPQALRIAEGLQEAYRHAVAQSIREAAERVPFY
jgi:hypothetical protein